MEKKKLVNMIVLVLLLFWSKKQKVEDVDGSPLSVPGLENWSIDYQVQINFRPNNLYQYSWNTLFNSQHMLLESLVCRAIYSIVLFMFNGYGTGTKEAVKSLN